MIFLLVEFPVQVLAKPGSLLVETSPFKGLWGQTTFRVEHKAYKTISIGYMAEHYDIIGEDEGFKDQNLKLSSEVLWYLPGTVAPNFFLSLGITGERELMGRKAQNPYHRFGSSSSREKYTFWVQKNYYLSLHQSIGVRFYSTYFWTASLKFLADELIAHSSAMESLEGDYTTAENNVSIRPLTKFSMLLHVGLWIP